MELSPTTANQTAVATAQATATADKDTSKSAISSDFETFLVMLTAQLENQDPLNPLDSQDFAVQLATFSGVEQQTKTNDLLTALGAQMTGSGLSQLADWIGKEARVLTPAHFTGAPVTAVPTIANYADRADLVVLDAAGTEIDRQSMPLDADTVVWSGQTQSGATFPKGAYTFYAESFTNNEPLPMVQASIYAEVTEARMESGVSKLVLSGGGLIDPANVIALRQ
jgi:flagellar basal-body rod modification protein FlgD